MIGGSSKPVMGPEAGCSQALAGLGHPRGRCGVFPESRGKSLVH